MNPMELRVRLIGAKLNGHTIFKVHYNQAYDSFLVLTRPGGAAMIPREAVEHWLESWDIAIDNWLAQGGEAVLSNGNSYLPSFKPQSGSIQLFEWAVLSNGHVYFPTYALMASRLKQLIPGLEKSAFCPGWGEITEGGVRCEPHRAPLWNIITHLNDHHKWSRERIADWLETLDIDLRFPTPQEREEDECL